MRFAVLLVAVLAAGCSIGGDTARSAPACAVGEVDGDLRLAIAPDDIDPGVVTAFEAAHGVTVTVEGYVTPDDLDSRPVDASPPDLIVVADHVIARLIEADALLPLRADALSNRANLAPEFAADLPFDPEGAYSVAYVWGTSGIGVDLGVTGPDVPRTWGLLFDDALAEQYGLGGEITVLADAREALGAALRYLGHSLNSTDAAELAAAKEVVGAAAGRGVVFDSDGYADLLLTGRSAVGHGYGGNFLVRFLEADEPAQYTYFVPDEGGARWVDAMAIPVDAAAPCTAHTFIDFVLGAEHGAAITNWTLKASPNRAAEAFIDPGILADPIIYPASVELEMIVDLGGFEAEYAAAFASALGDQGG